MMNQKNIAVLMSYAIDSYQQSILRGLEDAAKEQGYNLLSFYGKPLKFGKRKNGFDNPVFELIETESIHGIVSMSASISEFIGPKKMEDFLSNYKEIPIVSIGMELPNSFCITIDNAMGIHTIMNHLANQHGHKEFACIRGPENNIEANERFEAYKNYLKKEGLTYHEDLVYQGEFEPGDGINAITHFLDKVKKPFNALICEDDYAALEVIRELKNRGIKVPQEIAVFGFDNIESSAFSSPPLSTVDQPLYQMGLVAGKCLKEIFSGNSQPYNHKIAPLLITRESCGCSTKNAIQAGPIIRLLSERQWKKKDILKILTKRYEAVLKDDPQIFDDLYYLDIFLQKLYVDLEALLLNGDMQAIEEHSRIFMNACITQQRSFPYIEKRLSLFFEDRTSLPTLQLIWDQLVYFLLDEENKYRGTLKQDYDQLIAQHRDIGNKMLRCFNFEALQKLLADSISILRIKSVLLFLFEENPYEAKLFMALGVSTTAIEGKTYPLHSLFTELDKILDPREYHIHPLESEKEQMGFLLLDVKDSPGEFNDSIAEKISRSVETIQHINRLNAYTEELEQEVQRRTKDLEAANKLLTAQAYHDHLSGLHNRRFLNEIIVPEANRLAVAQVYRNRKQDKRDLNPNTTIAIFMIDLDFFKHVNDTYGHDSGDMVIQELSGLFKNQCREDDYIIRFGGEEFIVIMRNFDPGFLAMKAEQIRSAVESHDFIISENRKIKKTCSIGCMIFPANKDYPNEISFHNAVVLVDKAMYYAKEHGRNQARILEINPSILGLSDIQTELIDSFDTHLKEDTIRLLEAREILEGNRSTLTTDIP